MKYKLCYKDKGLQMEEIFTSIQKTYKRYRELINEDDLRSVTVWKAEDDSDEYSKLTCCANCKHLAYYPKRNRYGDIDFLCMSTSYFILSVLDDMNNIRISTPGGRKLECKFESR